MAIDLQTFEVSDPRFEHEDLRSVTAHSTALRGRGDITFFVPPGLTVDRVTPLMILLHGSYGSHWAWTGKGGAHRTAKRLIERGTLPPLVIGMPSDGLAGETTGYIAHDDIDFESWIVDEVLACALHFVPSVSSKSPLFISGLSIGGFGAMHLGCKYASRFSGISAHSSVTDISMRREIGPRTPAIHRLRIDPTLTVTHWAKRHRDVLPPLRFDCGTDDYMLGENRNLHVELEGEGIAHTYQEFPGGHTWDYWERHIEDTLLFFAKLMAAPMQRSGEDLTR
jgi:putative tributyrin esterase